MICDKLSNSAIYCKVHPNFKMAFDFLKDFEKNPLPVGEYKIDGDNVYAKVQAYETEPSCAKRWETHKEYIDIQAVFSGNEALGWTYFEGFEPDGKYNEENDVTFYKEHEGTELILKKGYFCILFPQDAHKPGCVSGVPSKMSKIVVKVRV
ncbi:MAG: YhcH/YjgK/YiaL family protein [Ruminiclostridium sp.]|nr:YhcH/YjgK/YiaL family protein [Ruminiclostridium sp.]